MNGKLAKKMRREARRLAQPVHASQTLRELKAFFNALPLRDRIRAAWRILRGHL